MSEVNRYTFDEICESQDFNHEETFILASEYEKLKVQLEKAEDDLKRWQSLWEEEINLAEHQRGRKIYFNDERLCQKQRKELKSIHQAGYNTLKSILSDQIGPDKVEQIIRNAEERARQYFKEKELK